MTLVAKDAKIGKIYRLTQDPGSTYYKLCEPAAIKRLEARIAGKNVLTMKPDVRALRRALDRCKKEGNLLFLRVMRLRREDGRPFEMRSYVAVPPMYAFREVSSPPSYGPKRRVSGWGQTGGM